MPLGRSLYDTAMIQRRLWTPENTRSAAWFDASDLSTITNTATGVSDWADRSGNGRTMSNATVASYRPDLAIGKRNGLSTLEFIDQAGAGSGDYRADRLQMASRINLRTAYVALARYGNAINGGSNFVFTDASLYPWHGSNNDTRLASSTYASSAWTGGSNFRNGAAVSDVGALGSGPLDELCIYSFLCSGTMETQGVGNDRTFHGSFGSYGEILWYNEAHTTRDRVLIEGYFSWKWGVTLAADHPFANRPPLIGD